MMSLTIYNHNVRARENWEVVPKRFFSMALSLANLHFPCSRREWDRLLVGLKILTRTGLESSPLMLLSFTCIQFGGKLK